MVFFSIASIPLLIPFLDILFGNEPSIAVKPDFAWEASAIKDFGYYHIAQLIETQGKQTALLYICIGFIIIFFFKNLFRYASMFFIASVRNAIVRDLRGQLFGKMMALPLSYFSDERKGDIMARATADVQEIEFSILNVLVAIIREPLMMIGALAIMISISPSLTMFVFGLLIFMGLIVGGIGRTLRRHSHDAQNTLGVLISILEETLGGNRIIKAFNAEKYTASKFDTANNDYRRSVNYLLWRRDLASPLSEFLGICTVAILLWYGGGLVFSGQNDASDFVAFLYAFFMVIDPAKSFSSAYYNVQKGVAAVERVEAVLDAPNEIEDKEGALPIHSFEQNILFDKVDFYYNKDGQKILDQINLDIPKGKMIALVGSSGAGKSTMADLLPRFYDVSRGSIRIDGKDIRDYKLKDLRSLMGVVSQEAILFNDSIYNNIVFGLENISKEEVIQAAKIANAHDFILEADNGYETVIGDRGGKLSGGQRQRITIARAILKNPPILILDEATSALDSESEQLVQEALDKVMQNRTAIVIAHRLTTIQNADKIIVMKDGKILEQGSHLELLEQAGEYGKLVQFQSL